MYTIKIIIPFYLLTYWYYYGVANCIYVYNWRRMINYYYILQCFYHTLMTTLRGNPHVEVDLQLYKTCKVLNPLRDSCSTVGGIKY